MIMGSTGRRYDAETRAACQSARAAGASLKVLAKQFGVSPTTVSYWTRDTILTPEAREAIDRHGQQTRILAVQRRIATRSLPSPVYARFANQDETRHEKSRISEAAVLFRLVANRYVPYMPMFDGERADFLVEVPESRKILRLQVKTARHGQHGRPYVPLTRTRGHNKRVRLTSDDCDFIVGYDFVGDVAYVWSFAETRNHRTCIVVTDDAAESWNKLRA